MAKLTGLDLDDATWWDIEQKGWFELARLEMDDGRVLELSFWEPARLQQEISANFAAGEKFFAPKNLVVVPSVNVQTVRDTVSSLLSAGYFL